MLFVLARVVFLVGVVVAVVYGAYLVVAKARRNNGANPALPKQQPLHHRVPEELVEPTTSAPRAEKKLTEAVPTIADIWALAALKLPQQPGVWLYARQNRNLRVAIIGQFLYIEQVDGDEYADRKRGTTLHAKVFIIERTKRMSLVCEMPLPVADTIEREVELAHKLMESGALRGKIAASDDALRKLKLDLSSAEDLSGHD